MAAPLIGVALLAGSTAADVTSTSGGSGWQQLAFGSATSVVVAIIGLYAIIRRRRGGDAEDINAVSIAMTTDTNLSTYRAETNLRLEALEQWRRDAENHLRPWKRT